MLDILTITAPIYLIVGLGYGLTRLRVFAKADMGVLGKFVVNLALPALLFKALAGRPLADILNPGYLAVYALGSLTVLAVGYAWGRRGAGRDALGSTFFAMGMSSSNSGFIGYPILLLSLPAVAGVALALNMMVENALVLPLVLILAERARGGAGAWATVRRIVRRLAVNPLILALVAGLTVACLGLPLPTALGHTVDMLAAASGALSLLVIGGTLAGLPVGTMGAKALPIVLGKLLLHPLAVFGGLLLWRLLGLPAIDPALQTAALIMAAMPMMSVYATLALQYGQQELSAVALLLATGASFFSLNLLLWLLQRVPLTA